MKGHEPNFYTLIPGRHTQAKGVTPDSYGDFYGRIRGWRTKYEEPGYSKLALLQVLAKRCRKITWVRENLSDLLYVYFLIIYDRGVLFAQTREHTSPVNGPTCQNFYTNRPHKTLDRKTAVEQVLQTIMDDRCTELYCRNGGLATSDLIGSLSVVTAEWIQPRSGRPPKLFYLPEKQGDVFMYRDCEEPEEVWKEHQERLQYEITEVLGKPASVYYQEHRQVLPVNEEQWRRIVLHYLERVFKQVTYLMDKQKHYHALFLPGQVEAFEKIAEQAHKTANFQLRLRRIWDKSNLLEECPLPASIPHNEKVVQFARSLGVIELKPTPVEAGILWFMRTGLHPLLGKRQLRKLPEDHDKVRIRAASRYFDRIGTYMDSCLVYSERELLSWNPACININVEKVMQNVAYQQLRSQVCARVQKDLTKAQIREVLTQYREYFFSPEFPRCLPESPNKDTQKRKGAHPTHRPLSIFLQSIVNKIDWHDLPTDQVCEKLAINSPKAQMTLRENLVEYACMEMLIRQGYKDLHEITYVLFHKIIVEKA